MKQQFTAVYQKTGKWYSAWVEEIPGVNTQGKTLQEAKDNLQEALTLILEVNKAMLHKDLKGKVIRETLTLQAA